RASAGRSRGWSASIASTASATAGGTHDASARSEGRGSPALDGARPVATAQASAPRPWRSDSGEGGAPASTSGAANAGVNAPGPVDEVRDEEGRSGARATAEIARAHETGDARPREQRELAEQRALAKRAAAPDLGDERQRRRLAIDDAHHHALRAAAELGAGLV